MIHSIRGRLQWWYGCVYALSILVFGCMVYWRADRDVHERATLQVVSAAQYLDASMRSLPPWQLTNEPRPPQFDQGGVNRPRREFPMGQLPPDFQLRPRNSDAKGENIIRLPAQNWDRRGPPPGSHGGPENPQPAFDRQPRDRKPRIDIPNVPPDNPLATIGDPSNPERPPVDRMEFAVWRADGQLISKSDGELIEPYLAVKPVDGRERGPQISHRDGLIQARMKGPLDSTILVLRPTDHDMSGLHRFGGQIAGMAAVTSIVGTVGGWWVSGRMVRPIQAISATASQISVTSLDRRIETRDLDEELVQLALVLNGAFERLEQSFGKLTQFTADASHELRTPLAVIQSQIELALSQPRTTDDYRKTLQTCLWSSERMRSLVDGLLLLARKDAERAQVRPAALDLRHVAEEAVVQLQDRAVASGVELECSTPDDPVIVSGDSTFLVRIPANLIDNAIQHTPSGGRVVVEVRREGNEAVLTVRDTGSGIDSEHLPFLFDRFYRVDTGRSRSHGGSGLGLAICRSLVESHQGTISCESVLGEGSTFTVRFPLAGIGSRS